MGTVVRGVAVWIVSGYLVLFACNGGAAGSAEVSPFAWACLAIYTVVFVTLFLIWYRRRSR